MSNLGIQTSANIQNCKKEKIEHTAFPLLPSLPPALFSVLQGYYVAHPVRPLAAYRYPDTRLWQVMARLLIKRNHLLLGRGLRFGVRCRGSGRRRRRQRGRITLEPPHGLVDTLQN